MLSADLAIFSLLVTLTLTLSLAGRELALLNLPNASSLLGHINQTTVISPAMDLSAPKKVYCLSLGGNALDLESCENAWLKLPVDSDIHIFRHRNEDPPASTMYGISLLSTIFI